MGSCGNCSQGKQIQCMCYKRNRDCNCHQQKCSGKKQLVKDCVCAEWTVPPDQTQTIFQALGHRHIFASGFISFDSGNSDFVTARFYLDGMEIGMPINIFQESSVAFSLTRFDRITVECAGSLGMPEVCEGEICITSRTPV